MNDFLRNSDSVSSQAVLQSVLKARMQTLGPVLNKIFTLLKEEGVSWGGMSKAHLDLMESLVDGLELIRMDLEAETGTEFGVDATIDLTHLFEEVVLSYVHYVFADQVDHTQFPDFLEVFLRYAKKDAALLGMLLQMQAPRPTIVSTLTRHVHDSIMAAMEEVMTHSHDGLTGFLRKEVFYNVCRRELERLLRHNPSMAVAMIAVDLDHFKTLNDTQGHTEGDRVLGLIGRLFKDALRTIDIVGRVGGDEFAVFAVVKDLKEAEMLGKRLREAVEDADLGTTLSVGISLSKPNGIRQTLREGGESMSGWIDTELTRLKVESDEAALVAKYGKGRNAVVAFENLTDSERGLAHKVSLAAARARAEAGISNGVS